MTEDVPSESYAGPDGGTALARSGPKFAALTGLTSLAILLQGVFAGEFIDHGAHGGWLNAHDVNGYVVVVLAVVTAAYAVVYLRAAARPLAVGSAVLAVLVIAQDAIGHAITDNGSDGLIAVHVPLALLVFGITIWLSVSARVMRRAASG
jgi:hypothetical protein